MTSFNVLTDPWIPLDDGAGRPAYASYVELLSGERDAKELAHPRDDVRFFSRMLLSALTQALFGDRVPDRAALRRAIAEPLPRADVEARVAEVRDDFELVGKGAFLQGPARHEKKIRDDEDVNSLLYDANKHQLYRTTAGVEMVSVESAVPLLYASQAFARKGGAGYFPGVRGAPPVTTLVRLAGIRASSWANVLHGQSRSAYPSERVRPWLQGADDAIGPIGLVEGLFWQPLGARLSWAEADGTCCAVGQPAGRRGLEVRRLGGRMRAGGEPFAHPFSPTTEEGTKRKFIHFRTGRPAWTGFGDVLPGLREEARRRRTRPAPVVEQWAELDMFMESDLILLDYVTKDASVVARFVELFPLSKALRDQNLADYATTRIEEADAALHALRAHLYPAKKKRDGAFRARTGGREKASDVTAAFWQRTEPCFWAWLDAKPSHEDAREAYREAIARATLAIFDEATSVLDSDPDALARVVTERRRLLGDLAKDLGWPRASEEHAAPALEATEVREP